MDGDIIKALHSSVKIKTDLYMKFLGHNRTPATNCSLNMEGKNSVGNPIGDQIRDKFETMSSQAIAYSFINKTVTSNTHTNQTHQTRQMFIIPKNANSKRRRKLRERNKAMLLKTAPILVQTHPQPAFLCSTNKTSCNNQTTKKKGTKRKKSKGYTSNGDPHPKKTRLSIDHNLAENHWLPQFQKNDVLIDTKVEIVADSNTGLLSKVQSDQILKILINKFCNANNYHLPIFQDNPKYVGGSLHLWCGNEPSFNWLKTAVKEISLPCCERLTVNRLVNVPRRVRFLISIPHTDAISEIFFHLHMQNRWADVEHWMYHNSYQQDGKIILGVSVPEYIMQTLIEREYICMYLLEPVYMRFMGNYNVFKHISGKMKKVCDGKPQHCGYPVKDLLQQILPASSTIPVIVIQDSE